MQDIKTNLQNRLEQIWELPDFTKFFEQFSKRPPLKIKRGSTIFFEGDEPGRIYFIKEGFVKLYHLSEQGRETIIYLYGPGSILGLRALTSFDKILKHDAQALTNVVIITISRNEYLDLLNKYPENIIDLLYSFIERLNYTERRLEGFIITDTTARVANFLYDLAKRFGKKENGHIFIPIPFTHQLIADFVGSFRETVSLSLKKLEKVGVQVKKGNVTITNIAALEKIVYPNH